MTTIRPNPQPPIAPNGPAASDAGRLAAQKAFFALVLGRTEPAAPTVAPAPEPASPAVARTAAAAPAEAPAKIARPGSLFDIRV